jgi:hypothetical protein
MVSGRRHSPNVLATATNFLYGVQFNGANRSNLFASEKEQPVLLERRSRWSARSATSPSGDHNVNGAVAGLRR